MRAHCQMQCDGRTLQLLPSHLIASVGFVGKRETETPPTLPKTGDDIWMYFEEIQRKEVLDCLGTRLLLPKCICPVAADCSATRQGAAGQGCVLDHGQWVSTELLGKALCSGELKQGEGRETPTE